MDTALNELLSEVEVVLESVLRVLLRVRDISGVTLSEAIRLGVSLRSRLKEKESRQLTIAASTTPPAFFAASIPRRMFSM